MRTDTPPVVRLEDYRPSDFLIDRVDLDIRLHPTETRITAILALRPNPAGLPDAPLVLDGDELILLGAALDGKPLSGADFAATPQSLTLPNPPRRPFTLTLDTQVNPTANTKLMGLYRSSGVYCTQCEAEGFRRITYFLDRPDVLSVYTTRLEADRDEAPILLGNGNPVESGAVDGTSRHYAVWHDPFPKPAYLFALVGGRLGHVRAGFTTLSGRHVTLAVYVEPGKEARAGYALDALERSMRWDERVFGREYDLDVFNIVAVSDFNMGAMENKGLNIFNDKYVLASPETATDNDYAAIEAIIAHEYFHNWTGNRITCRAKRFPRLRGHPRARVFPHLEGTPPPPPRLVPAPPQGGPDRFRGQGVLARRALPPGPAHPRGPRAAPPPVRRGRGSARPSG